LITEEGNSEEILSRFLKEHPLSLDRPSAQLLLGLVYLEQGLLPLAEEELRKVQEGLLPPHEAAQHSLALGYILLRTDKDSSRLDEAQLLLERAAEDPSPVGEQALLYLGSLAWAKGKTGEAKKIFTARSYSAEFASEAAYQATLLSFSTDPLETALQRATELQRTYPEVADRPTLRSLIGQAYFIQGKYTEAELLGCYPLPNPLHNMHLIKAMREFFTQENPEFLKHIGRFYRTPWLRPGIAFCNSFSFIRFPVSSRKKINQAIAEQKAFWNTLSYKQQMQRYDKAVKEQQELNEQLASEGLINEVNDDWEETEKSPALSG